MLLTDVPNRTAIHAASQKDLRVIHIPLRWTGSLYWNGRIVDRSGLIVWGELPDLLTVVGIATLISAGLYTFYRERRLAMAASRSRTSDTVGAVRPREPT